MNAAQSARNSLSDNRRWSVLLGSVMTVWLIAGCSGNDPASSSAGAASVVHPSSGAASEGSVASASAGLPGPDQATGMTEPDSAFGQAVIAWDLAGKYLLVTTYGSSGCPNTIDRVIRAGDQRLEFATGDTAASLATTTPRTCTADLAPFTSSVVVPAGISRTESLTVVFQGTEIVVPAQG